jgi:WD40 repeat protein
VRAMENQAVSLSAVLFTRDGGAVVSAATDGTLKIWNTATGDLLLTLPAHSSAVTGLVLSADGKLLVSAAQDGSISFWGIAH